MKMFVLHVIFQCGMIIKYLFAHRARKFTVFFVNLHVLFEIRLLVEMTTAHLAAKWSLARMDEHVIAQISPLVKTFAARVAYVLLACAVRAHVHL